MKSRFVLSLVTIFAIVSIVIIAMAMLMPIANADEIRISSIDDSYINKEVTVSGVVVSTSYESGHKRILTIDDGSGTIFVNSDPRLFGDFYGGERITVNGVYVGESMIYPDLIYPTVGRGYKDVTIAELKEFSEYYYADSVRIKGKVDRIELIPEKTELTIDDDTGTIDVEYGAEMEDIKIGDEVIVEGKCYRNVISASTIEVERPEQELNQTLPNQFVTPTPEPEEEPHPAITPGQSPGPQTETPVPMPTKPGKLPAVLSKNIPLYLVLIFVSAAILVVIFFRPKIEEWLMMRRYSK